MHLSEKASVHVWLLSDTSLSLLEALPTFCVCKLCYYFYLKKDLWTLTDILAKQNQKSLRENYEINIKRNRKVIFVMHSSVFYIYSYSYTQLLGISFWNSLLFFLLLCMNCKNEIQVYTVPWFTCKEHTPDKRQSSHPE